MNTCGKCPSNQNKKPKMKNPAEHDPKECGHRLKGRLIHQKKKNPKESKKLVIVYDNDQVRDLVVPERNPTDLAGIWPKSEFNRLQKQSRVMTIEEKKAMIEEMERKKREEMRASEMRKEDLAKAQVHQDPHVGSKLDNVELDAQKKSEYLLERSHELLNEQDDRVKVANCIILATKCRAIRNAQIMEKELIKKQLQQEERRLDDMMEQARQRALREDEKKAELEEHKNKRYGREIKQQIKDNEVEKLLEAEKIEEESRLLNRALIAMRKEEEEKVKEHKEHQKRVREELHQANLDLERYKLVQKEEQRIADLRIQEFMRQKAAREEAREAELAMIKAAKEKEIARLRAQQQRAQDKQALMDEMQAIRIQEEVERAWREKEKQAAIKKAEDIQALHEARSRQISDIRTAQAIAIARDEDAFHKVAKVQQELFEKDQTKRAQRKDMNFKHRKDILKQINDKERERINHLKEKFEDGRAFRLNQELHDNQISEYIKTKVSRLRTEALPDRYITDIERQLKLRE
ncbi:cilia- and flagella-associated protein 45-like [Harmonia axyridis]|uniref:cilia- and flagella-associated protein 45-like n=1 Tax=Harmonia axyridis TaxID=115357 RepID=UPI001E278980|nr:cilia- and flagella-associated protein 45-like [Harmonia axyridis]